MGQGIIQTVKDLVVMVVFDDDCPDINELILVDNPKKTLLLVDSVSVGNKALCLNIYGDRTIQKGMAVKNTGKSIEIPVGDKTIGRMLDALGNPIDGLDSLDSPDIARRNIFDTPVQNDTFKIAKPEILETGVKVIDFFTPFVKGRKIGIIGGAGVGKTILMMELMHNVAMSGSGLSFFTGIGERIREGHELYMTLKDNNLLGSTCMVK